MKIYKNSFILITPARNESGYIDQTIRSVLQQRIRPIRWIIVVNGSTDNTRQIASSYADQNPFISVEMFRSTGAHNYSNKALAINWAYEQVKDSHWDFIGILDADITLPADYFQRLLEKFREMPDLGVAGGWITEKSGSEYTARFGNREEHVPGAVQFFRRQCFEQLDGFIPLPYGGEDMIANEQARRNHWRVRSFPELPVFHNRRTGDHDKSLLKTRFRQGIADYHLAYHPIYVLGKNLRRIHEKPALWGSILRNIGYFYAWLRREQLLIPDELKKVIRRRQWLLIKKRLLTTEYE